MAAALGGGDGALGGLPIEQWWFEMPAITRWWTTATVVTGVLVQCHILTPFQLFYSFRAVFHKQQVGLHIFLNKNDRILTYITVLAPPLHLHLLRPPLPQSPLPHLLHPTLRPHARRIRRKHRPLLLAHGLRRDDAPPDRTTI